MHLIAYGESNWNYYVRTYDDGTQAVVAIAKPESGAASCHYCSVKNLRAHFRHLNNIKYGRNWTSLIPSDWKVTDVEFFNNLGIK